MSKKRENGKSSAKEQKPQTDSDSDSPSTGQWPTTSDNQTATPRNNPRRPAARRADATTHEEPKPGRGGKGIKNPHKAPIAPPNTVFLLKQNPSINPKRKFVLGNPEPKRLLLELYDTMGRRIPHYYTATGPRNWNDPRFIKKINSWRDQAIRRHFKDDPGYVIKKRANYTWMEKEFFGRKLRRYFHRKKLILESRDKAAPGDEKKDAPIYVKKNIRDLMKLDTRDWKQLAKKHNRYFAGKNVPIGEPRKGGEPAKKEFEITNRKYVSLKNVYSREQQAAMIDEVVDGECNEVGATDSESVGEEDNNAAEGDSDQDSDGEDHDSQEESDDGIYKGYHGYKEESDDEDDGRRMTSNTTGGIRIPTYRY